MMFGIGHATRIYLAVGGTDMRKSFEGLSGLIREKLRADPLSGHLFLFCNKPRNRLKVVFWDGHGLWVCAKRLEKGRFSWPVPGEDATGAAAVTIKQEELAMLLGGIEMARTERKQWWRRDWEES
jgi:transposase